MTRLDWFGVVGIVVIMAWVIAGMFGVLDWLGL